MDERRSRRLFIIIAFGIPFLVTCLVSHLVFGGIPHVQDSIAQVFQGKIFASGRLYAQSHPLKEFFDYTHMINNGRWYSQYPPGHSLFLVFGVLLGLPWLVNPLLGSLAVLLVYFLGRRLYDEKTGRWAAIFTMLSPFFIFMSSEFMSHSSAMFTFVVFAFCFFQVIRTRKKHWALFAGLFLGLCMLTRPYTAFGLVIPFVLYALVLLYRKPKEHFSLLASVLAALVPSVVFLLLYNYYTNGAPLRFGYTVLYGPAHGLGLGKGIWDEPHTLARGLADLWDSIRALNTHFLGWPVVTFLPILVLLASGKALATDYLLLASFASLAGIHVLYWYHDLCLGPRFLYEALPFLVILTVRGLSITPHFFKERLGFRRMNVAQAGRVVVGTVVVLFLYDVFITIPGLIRGKSDYFWTDRQYANSYWGVDAYLENLVKRQQLANAIVFVDFDYPAIRLDSLLWYGSGFLNNSPALQDNIIYARHRGSCDTLLMNYYPDRKYYIYQGKLQMGGVFEIGKGSFSAPGASR